MVDADMGFAPDTVEQLIAAADRNERPVVGGLCFGQKIVGHDPHLHHPIYRQFPTMYQWAEDGAGKPGFVAMESWTPGAVVRVGATGAACILMHRSALVAMRERYGDHWWTQCQVDGEWFSEDMSFCIKLATLDLALHVHTGVETSHLKPTYLTANTYQPPVRLATRVVIPSRDGGANLRALIGDLDGQVPLEDVLVVDDGLSADDVSWLTDCGVEFIAHPSAGIHAAWNLGLDWAAGRGVGLVALLNDDVRLGDGCVDVMSQAFAGVPDLVVACPNYDGRDGSGVQFVTDICANTYDGTGGVAGFAMWLAPALIANYRFPDELMWWYGDNDVVATATVAGRRCGVELDARCEHVDGGSQTGDWSSAEMTAALEADRQAFEVKWGLVDA
jgi:GT2 family glycosyltransferase